jgi:hypothetical protein
MEGTIVSRDVTRECHAISPVPLRYPIKFVNVLMPLLMSLLASQVGGDLRVLAAKFFLNT